MEPFDLYNEVEMLAKELSAKNFQEESHQVLESLASGATSGEILGELRAMLLQTMPSIQSEAQLVQRSQSIVDYIDSVLGPL